MIAQHEIFKTDDKLFQKIVLSVQQPFMLNTFITNKPNPSKRLYLLAFDWIKVTFITKHFV